MIFKEVAETAHLLGYQVIPVKGKRPVIEAWQDVKITTDMVKGWAENGKGGLNTGIRTGVGTQAVYAFDCDIYDPVIAVKVRKAFWETFGSGPLRVGQKPKSLTIYAGAAGHQKMQACFVAPDGVEHKIEILGAGQQFVAFGVHPDTGLDYEWPSGASPINTDHWELAELDFDKVGQWLINELPHLVPSDWKLKTLSAGTGLQATGGSADGATDVLDLIKPRVDITIDEAREYVSCLDPECDYDGWAQIMFAIHHQTGGSPEGFALFDEQSRRSSKYDANTTRYKWEKIKDSPRKNTITFATIIHLARQTDAWRAKQVAAAKEVAENWQEKIDACMDADELATLVTQIALDGELSVIGHLKIEQSLIGRFKTLGVKVTKQKIGQMYAAAKQNRKSVAAGQTQNDQRNAWCSQYVWVKFEDSFTNIQTQEIISVQSFNAQHGRDVRGVWVSPDGFQLKASEVALQEIQIPVVSRRMYLPAAEERFSIAGLDYINSYRKSSVPDAKMPEEWNEDDAKAVEAVKAHIKLICTDASEYMTWWMAHNVQFAGLKIRHSPLIKGIEGDGKSLFGEIMAKTMGEENVRIISPKVLMTDFNGWAEGHCVGVLEEIRIVGHNRYDAANAVKPNITNDTIAIHRKGKDEYNIPNVSNYMGVTNYPDALPLSDTDRRWTIIFSPFWSQNELLAAIGDDYFDNLFNAIRNHAEALRGWLLTEDVTKFDRNGRAFHTNAKAAMVAAARPEIDDAILEVIADGAVGVCETVISTKHLGTALAMMELDVEFNPAALVQPLKRLGFMKYPKQIKWCGSPIRVWTKGNSLDEDNLAIREALNATLKTDDEKYSNAISDIPF